MQKIKKIAGIVLLVFILSSGQFTAFCASKPISLHPENPHYFLWRGKPTILITSGEHYGAVLNAEFNYKKYLETLAKDKLNNTRTFVGGAYVEPAGAFNIEKNTLAPAPNKYITPWKRSNEPGYYGGGNKFNLEQWDVDYFKRLKDFVSYASKLGIVVEINLFCPFYEEIQWKLSPFNIINNVNNIGNVERTNVYTLDKNGGLLKYQERMVRKIVDELRDYDNVYYEICNEPYFGGVTMEWQHYIADIIQDAQKNHKYKKLISQNIANGKAKIIKPHPAISIFNFHYANPPDTVEMNYHLNKVIGDNETGFRGTNDFPYRTEAWEFIIAGGGLFNNLDYSFAVGYEDGTFIYPPTQPGGGNPQLRKQFKILIDFINSFDFIKMKPDNTIIKKPLPDGIIVRALAQPDKAYAIYVRKSKPKLNVNFESLKLELKPGNYNIVWISPVTGNVIQSEKFKSQNGLLELKVPDFDEDLALKIKKN